METNQETTSPKGRHIELMKEIKEYFIKGGVATEPKSMKEIAAELGASAVSVSHNVEVLQAKGELSGVHIKRMGTANVVFQKR